MQIGGGVPPHRHQLFHALFGPPWWWTKGRPSGRSFGFGDFPTLFSRVCDVVAFACYRRSMKISAKLVWFAFGVGLFVMLLTGNPVLLRVWAALGGVILLAMFVKNRMHASDENRRSKSQQLEDARRSIDHHGRKGTTLDVLVGEELRAAEMAISEADDRSRSITFNASAVASVADVRRRLREFAIDKDDAVTLARARSIKADAEGVLADIRRRGGSR